jgi:hypothetical protein
MDGGRGGRGHFSRLLFAVSSLSYFLSCKILATQDGLRTPNLAPEDDRFITESMYAATNLKKLNARFVFDGEQFDPVCSCKPPPPEHGRKCYPSKVTIIKGEPFPGKLQAGRLLIDAKNLRKLIGDPSDLKMVDAATHFASDIDGRSSDEIFGVWGGEFGELILAMSVWEDNNLKLLGVPLTPLILSQAIVGYIQNCADTRKFMYFHTDTDALAWVESQLGGATIDITSPPEKHKEALLKLIIRPEAQGCMHLKQILLHPDDYGVRLTLVQAAITEFYKIMWDIENELRQSIKYYVLHAPMINGRPNEVAWVNMKVGSICELENYMPLFPPWSNDVSIYVFHPQYAEVLHKRAALVVNQQTGGTADTGVLRKQLKEKYEQWDEKTKSLLPRLAGLPVFDVVIDAFEPETEAPAIGDEPSAEKPVALEMYKVGKGGMEEKLVADRL